MAYAERIVGEIISSLSIFVAYEQYFIYEGTLDDKVRKEEEEYERAATEDRQDERAEKKAAKEKVEREAKDNY